ncbi:hypothetical protein ATN88_14380 [Enterovibrio coralii]|uniref:Chemotaxis protein n=2 Tax=Enterovibrio coralii TaxID=294935 RepID=A0A135IB72_9GAMM|nr:hypothetical protein ATN88_14380 [Enterovibrio coralii]
MREQVDSLKPTDSPFVYYSTINKHAIIAAGAVASQSSDPIVTEKLNALLSIITMKEKAGQSRGALNGIFARGSTTLDAYARIQNYIEEFNFATLAAEASLHNADLKALKTIEAEPVWAEVNAIEESFLAQKSSLNKVEGPSPQEWFPLATKRIVALNKYKNAYLEQLKEAMHQRAENAANASMYLIVGLGLIIVFVSIIAVWTINSIRRRIASLGSQLQNMISNKDMTHKLNNGSTDEIGDVEGYIDGFVANIREILRDTKDLTQETDDAISRLTKLASKDVESAKETSTRCETLAAAMTQMSTSSSEVASYAQTVEEATAMAKDVTSKAVSSGDQSAKTMDSLISSIDTTFAKMKELQSQTANVKEILDNITGISEQTNLLALNAAIEAARAGEMGRGFAVVADEVRNLAQRSKQSTEEIGNMLDEIRMNTESSFSNMERSRDVSYESQQSVETAKGSLEVLGDNISNMADQNALIADSARQQAQTVSSVSSELEVLVSISSESSEGSLEIERSLMELRERMRILNRNVGQFGTG